MVAGLGAIARGRGGRGATSVVHDFRHRLHGNSLLGFEEVVAGPATAVRVERAVVELDLRERERRERGKSELEEGNRKGVGAQHLSMHGRVDLRPSPYTDPSPPYLFLAGGDVKCPDGRSYIFAAADGVWTLLV
jgi:hypothetical protein